MRVRGRASEREREMECRRGCCRLIGDDGESELRRQLALGMIVAIGGDW